MEKFVTISGFEDYIISNTGRVISFHKKGMRELKHDHTRSYPCVTLCNKGKQRRVMLHILVAEHFLSPVDGKTQVNHKDGDKNNPHVDNLEWCTQSENQLHAFATGLQQRSGMKRTEEQVHEVCRLISDGLVRGDILLRCPYMSKAVFDNIRSRRRWTHVSKNYEW